MLLIDQVFGKVKDDSGRLTDSADYQPAIDAALETYSKDRPRTVVVDSVGAGTHDVALPDDWVEEFSTVKQVEYPVDEVEPVLVPKDLFTVYRKPSGEVLRLFGSTPDADEAVRITITVPRTESTIVTGDLDAVASLAAANCCELLANIFAQTSDPTIQADVVNYRTKSGEFAARAKALRKIYTNHMGIKDGDGAPASTVVAAPKRTGLTMTHGWRA